MVFKHVDLCSGIGGFALGFEWAKLSKPVLFCDIEPWSRQILAKHWPDVPIATDVKELANDPDGLVPDCDILTAGYPCQPFSQAGQRRGSEDDRHIWPYIFSIIQGKRPTWCVFENVYGHVSLGLDEVLSDLESEAYAARPFIVPACATDAPHRRDRLWIIGRNVADTDIFNRGAIEKSRKPKRQTWGQSPSNSSSDVADAQSVRTGKSRHAHKTEGSTESSATQPNGSSADVADAQSKRLEDDGRCGELGRERDRRRVPTQSGGEKRSNTWKPEPPVGRVANGIPRRVDRLKGLGNAIVPQIAMRIGLTIKEISEIPAQG
jgi:DNA (cytosine-5)-methyltransferase 1